MHNQVRSLWTVSVGRFQREVDGTADLQMASGNTEKKVARIGCSACALANVGGPWANFDISPLSLRMHHLKRHETSGVHRAVCDKAGSVSAANLAPPLEIFKDALDRMRKGGSSREGGVASDKKHQVRWCLSEAAMEVGRGILRDASCIALTRDERKGRLLVRWRACGPDLSCASTSGVLGFAPAEGFADSLAEAVKKMVQSYCTPRQGLPRGFEDPLGQARLQKDVEENICARTGILVTDAAAPELLASGLLQGVDRMRKQVSGRIISMLSKLLAEMLRMQQPGC